MHQYFKYSNSLLFAFDPCPASWPSCFGSLDIRSPGVFTEPSSIIIVLIFVNRTLRRIKSSRLIGLVLHAVTLIFFKEHPSHSALCFDISVELSPFAVKSMFWLRSGPITLQEITYPGLVVARTGKSRRGAGRDEVWHQETMFSQLAKRSPCMVVSGKLQSFPQ